MTEKSDHARREEEILKFWQENRIFERSLEKPAPRGEFLFYDGPPFANGLPHYGHILASTIKDTIPRFRTMQGYRVPRQWGWDCHGLPVENLVEKELGFSTKREIEQYGIEKFNAAARTSIMKDVADWKRIIPRIGRWADMERDYKTMDASYTESVWWSFKELWKKGLVEKSFKSMHLCPHCGTTLSNFEVSQGYKDIQDIAVTAKFRVKNPENIKLSGNVYLLAWTTTPWTLPGNVALAVGSRIDYVALQDAPKFGRPDESGTFPTGQQGIFIVAKNRAHVVVGPGWERRVVTSITGDQLVSLEYEPLFDYYAKDETLKNRERGWKVYAADFVTTEDGTGIVHIAPAFGEDDLQLAKKEGLPIIHHVQPDGAFAPEVKEFAGKQAKPKGDHHVSDVEIIKNLAHRGLLFAKEKITHSYPHCWRCDTPLLNYASTSWFVNVPAIKHTLIAENRRIGWVPRSVGEYRFGNWLAGAREWAISRSRFWGAPLPIWEAEDGRRIVIGSREELAARIKRSGNRYLTMRHGEAESNVKNVYSSDINAHNPLTKTGIAHVRAAAERLKGTRIDLIIASPFERTKQTAEIVREVLGLPASVLSFDARIGEVQYGTCDGAKRAEPDTEFRRSPITFTSAPEGGETLSALKRRVGDFLYDIEKKYSNKNILIVSHGGPLWFMQAVARGLTADETLARRSELYPKNADIGEIPFVPLPVNAEYEIDYHRPFIDAVVLMDENGKEYRRVPEVFDCWYESGSMPFASKHYPFRKDAFDPMRWFGFGAKGYPADFIAEGLDQTRGWFYSLIVLGVALFGRAPYKRVIVNGLVLAEDGQKMSKRLKNYPDPMDVVDQCGADAMRYYMLSSPVVRGEDLHFSLRGVQEVASKLVGRLANVLSFYQLYAKGEPPRTDSTHVLDRWILSRLAELTRDVTDGYERYELDSATRPLASFIDDLSIWYLRRSRERIKHGDEDARAALGTLRHILKTLALVMAPAMPFFADYLFRAVREKSDAESVHLSEWPAAGIPDTGVLSYMKKTREIVTQALEARDKAGIKVRQPLETLTVDEHLPAEYLALVRDEVNVKSVVVGAQFSLDTAITPELREEGIIRDTIRLVQDARKAAKLKSGEPGSVSITLPPGDKEVAERHLAAIQKQTNTKISLA